MQGEDCVKSNSYREMANILSNELTSLFVITMTLSTKARSIRKENGSDFFGANAVASSA